MTPAVANAYRTGFRDGLMIASAIVGLAVGVLACAAPTELLACLAGMR